jgi:nucleotide-binding universal stress UspA family protein
MTMAETLTAPVEGAPAPLTQAAAGPVVVAVGGLDPESVIRAARVLAPHAPDGILVATVLEPPPAAIVGAEPRLMPPSWLDQQRAELAGRLTEQLRRTGGSAAWWQTRVVDGEPAFALTDLAAAVHSPLLVMGIGRHRTLDRVFGSETTLRAIRLASCPVLAVHPDLDGPFHDAVVAVDFSPASAHAARAALPLLGPSATLHLVHVWAPSATDDEATMAANEAYEASLPARFRRFVDLLAVPPGTEVKTVTREGRPAERVLDYAAAHHADLVVAGRHGMSLFARMVVGSQTTAMLRDAGRTVLVAPEPPFAVRDELRRPLTGASRSTHADEWVTQLDGFTERNHGRPVSVDAEDLVFGARVVDWGLAFVRAAYDADAHHVEVRVEDADRPARRTDRVIRTVTAVAVTTDSSGKDLTLRVDHGGGCTVLTFTDA